MSESFYYEKLAVLNQAYYQSLPSASVDSLLPHPVPAIEKITTPLYDHQVRMVHAMHAYQEKMTRGFLVGNQAINGKIGIVGDAAGSGKTLTVLAYLASLSPSPAPRFTCELTPHSSRFFYSHDIHPFSEQASANLIIVPHSLFHEWRQEIRKHTTLSYLPIETRRMLRGEELANEMKTTPFILTTNKCYKYVQEYATAHHIQWNHIVLDEATSIYMNSSDPPLHFQFLWLVTHQWIPLLFKNPSFHPSTLLRVKGQLALHPELEQWLTDSAASHYDGSMVSSGFLKDYLPYYHPNRHQLLLRNTEETIQTALALPAVEWERIRCRPNITFHSLMAYYVSRHLEPSITSSHVPTLFESLGVTFQPAPQYTHRHPLSKQPLIQRMVSDNECVICLEHCEHPTMVDCCFHLYCGKCILRSILMNGRCPTCREQMTPPRLTCLTGHQESPPTRMKSKSDTCLDWIRNHPAGRFIIYSAFDNIYYQLFEEIDRMGRKAERVENNLFSLLKAVKHFKQGTTQILFVSNVDLLRGLSFPFTTHLIFYHDQLSYEKRRVLIQSAQRVGRTQTLKVVQLHSEIQV